MTAYNDTDLNSKNQIISTFYIKNPENVTITKIIDFKDSKEECEEKILNSYKKLSKNSKKLNEIQKVKVFLLDPYFQNEFIDENDVKDFSLDKNIDDIKSSILFKKNKLNEQTLKIKNIFGEDNKINFSFSSCIIKYWNKLKDEDEEENNENNISFKYQNFWINGLKIIIFELIAIFFILRIFTLLNYFSFNLNGKKDINQYFNNFTLNFNFTRDNEDKSWNNFISNEYRCLSLDIYNLLD